MILVFEQIHRQQENLRLTMNETIPYLPGLSPVAGKELHARFDGGRLSSDGGVLFLREIESGLGLADVLSSCMKDARDPLSTTHTQAQGNNTQVALGSPMAQRRGSGRSTCCT